MGWVGVGASNWWRSRFRVEPIAE
jgi:hypothetical protein